MNFSKFRFRKGRGLVSGRVLDIGCGGDYCFVRDIRGIVDSVVGVDKRFFYPLCEYPNLRLVEENIGGSLPFGDSEFDTVTMLAFLEHVDYPLELLGECLRVLKPLGRLVVTVPKLRAKYVLSLLGWLGVVDFDSVRDHKTYFSRGELSSLFLKSGFCTTIEDFNCGFNFCVVGVKPC